MSSKSTILAASLSALAVAALCAWGVNWSWTNRDTDALRRGRRKEAAKELRASSPDRVLSRLRALASERSFRVWFEGKPESAQSPWKFWTLRCGMLTRVPYDTVGQLAEDQFIRFAGDGGAKAPDAARLKELLVFSNELLGMGVLSKAAENALRERSLDGLFLVGDFDGAVALLENGGVASRSPGWCKGTAAKLRAHKAMEAGDKKEAIRQLLVFGEFMLSDEQKDFEDCDPTTGLLYSREWVAARNFMRCANMSKEIGDAEAAAKYLAEAKGLFATAHEKARDDKKSLEAIEKEMRDAKVPVPAAAPAANAKEKAK